MFIHRKKVLEKKKHYAAEQKHAKQVTHSSVPNVMVSHYFKDNVIDHKPAWNFLYCRRH